MHEERESLFGGEKAKKSFISIKEKSSNALVKTLLDFHKNFKPKFIAMSRLHKLITLV
jgi:hypothetical protein